MKTEIIKIDENNINNTKISKAADIIKNGGLVAFPTETVYGLGANALDTEAIKKIFKAKGRPGDNPLIVHICNINQINILVKEVSDKAKQLMKKYWPGPLTIIFDKSEKVPDSITGGLSTVAVRMPNHKIALELIKQSDLPIAAPSANTSGKPSPTDFFHVKEDLSGKIDLIINGGRTGIGVESTVLDVSGNVPTILRPGGITKENLLSIFSEVRFDPAIVEKDKNLVPKSPGQKYKHYSPKAEVKIVKGNREDIVDRINELCNKYMKENVKIGIMATEQTKDKYGDKTIIVVGDRNVPQTIATNLFKTLRDFDKLGVRVIIAEGIEEKGIGRAIMNRMYKASGGNLEEV